MKLNGLALLLNSMLKYKIKASKMHATNQTPPLALIPFTPQLGLLNYTIAFIERENL